jgi:two-component system, NtrC family, sensor kinase
VNWYALNYIFGSLSSLGVGVAVLYRGDTRKAVRGTWISLCVAISLWYAGRFLMETAQQDAIAMRAVYLVYLGAIFIPPCYLHFVLSLLNEEKGNRLIWSASYFFALLELMFLLSGTLTNGVQHTPGGFYYEVPGPNYFLYVGSFIALPCFSFIRLIQAYSRSELPFRRNQLKYVIYSGAIGFAAGATSFLPFINPSVPPLGAPLVYLYTFPIAYAMARHRLMDIDVAIKRSLIHALLLLALLIPCYLIVILGQQLAFGTINTAFSAYTLGLLIIVGFLFPKIRFRTEEALERVLFKKRTDHRETLLRSSQEMVSVVDLKALSESLAQTVGRALAIAKVSLFLLEDGKGSFTQVACRGFENGDFEFPLLGRADPLVQKLSTGQKVLVKEELAMADSGSRESKVAEVMGQMEAEISVPIVSKQKLIGILNLGRKEDKEIYSTEDLELLSTLANQAAIAIENARLYENLKQSQNTLRRADRLSSLGLLTAGLAHEIRNPLVAIRTFTQLLPERYDDAEFREGFQGLALKEVDRICGLINDLLSFARPSRPNVAEEDMNDVVDGIARILETEAKEKGVQIARDFGVDLPKIWIDREQLKQVFMNLILNAIQAMRDGGSILISTRLNSNNEQGQSRGFVQVEIRDTGMGIPEENLEHIFDPFFTSKDEGSGLGLSISHQIVQEHGGYILVQSKVGEGTAFFINLPAGKPVRLTFETRTQAQ